VEGILLQSRSWETTTGKNAALSMSCEPQYSFYGVTKGREGINAAPSEASKIIMNNG